METKVKAEPRAYSWIQQSINPYPYYETDVTREMISELDIINNFVSKVVSESQELNPDMARLINKNFWELV